MRNTSNAQLEMLSPQEEHTPDSPLKQAVAERLAQHRARGAARRPQPAPEPQLEHALTERAERARAAVAERYAKTPTYREVLASEAQRAVREAEAAAEVAAVSARAIVRAQQQLLAELEHWKPIEQVHEPEPVAEQFALLETAPIPPPEELRVQHHKHLSPLTTPPVPAVSVSAGHFDEFEQQALDEEIEFRQAPDFPVHETIAANLIEFPRQLVASVKARPRLAEGPLRDEDPGEDQLQIFEVDSTQLSTAPVVEAPYTEWSPLILETAARNPEPEPIPEPIFLPQVAPIGLRAMSGIVDGCLVLVATLIFLVVAAVQMNPLPQKYVLFGFPATFLVLHTLYQLLFFTWSETTPGMRYARIGLCTFNDENPSRQAMRRRILAGALSAAPLGIGFLWAILDEDGLGWHDRISRIYQRSY